jgi:restriction system protein
MARKTARSRRKAIEDRTYLVVLVLGAIYLASNWLFQHSNLALPLLLLFTCLVVVGLALLVWLKSRRRARLRFHAESLAELLALTPTQFEIAVADLLTSLGYKKVKVLGKSGDLMADITAQDPNGKRIICQCKRYQPGLSVSSPEIQKFIGMAFAHHGAQGAIYVTTSNFTAPARALAANHRISLWDGPALTAKLQSLHLPPQLAK